jgi:hypothetical protein
MTQLASSLSRIAVFALAFFALVACSAGDGGGGALDASVGDGGTADAARKICTPGARVICACNDVMRGTRLCNDAGSDFAMCECM